MVLQRSYINETARAGQVSAIKIDDTGISKQKQYKLKRKSSV